MRGRTLAAALTLAAGLLGVGCLADLSGTRCDPGEVCGEGYVCAAGRCATSCPAGQRACGSTCAVGCSDLDGGDQGVAVLSPASASFSFAGVEVAGQSTQTYDWTLQNTGDLASAPLSTTAAPPFFVVSDACQGAPLAVGAACTVRVAFRPNAPGVASGLLTVGGPGVSASLNVTGAGLWKLEVLPRTGGWVETTDLRIANCSASSTSACSALYADGDTPTLRARTANGSNMHFAGWVPSQAQCGGPGAGALCQVRMNGSLTAAPRFSPFTASMAFVTSAPLPADLGLLAYDQTCNTLASDAGINSATGDAYIAWLSVAGLPASKRFTADGGVQRMDGTPMALTRDDLLNSRIMNPPNLNELGQRITGADESLWTGTDFFGEPTGLDCSEWRDRDAGVTIRGTLHGGPGLWTQHQTGHPCDDGATRVLCLENTRSGGLTAPQIPAGGHIAFRTSNVARPTSLLAADTRCDTNRPPGTTGRVFRALLAGDGTSAWSRFSGSETALYYRMDGAFVGTGDDIKNERLVSGIWRLDEIAHRLVWTGATSVTAPGTAQSTCGNWTQANGTARLGESNTVAGKSFFDAAGQNPFCGGFYALYCLEP